jgi:hypothetical protein
MAKLEAAEWYCYRNRQIFTYDETVLLKVTLLYLLIYTMVETQGISKRKYKKVTLSDLRIFTHLQILLGQWNKMDKISITGWNNKECKQYNSILTYG